MKINRSTIFSVLGVCIFMGITGISIGLGAIYPPLNRIAKPLVCPNGEMIVETQTYRPTPVETVTTVTWYCVDSRTGDKAELGIFPMCIYAGTFYGLLLFGGALAYMLISANRQASAPVANDGFKLYKGDPNERASRIKDRLAALNKLHEANVISEEEYRKRRTRILEDV